MAMRAAVDPAHFATYPGFPIDFAVTVTNALDVVDAYSVRVIGVDPKWVSVDEERLQLFPGSAGTFQVRVTLPDDFPAGQRVLTVQVISELAPTRPTLLAVSLDVNTRKAMSIRIEPPMAVCGSKASFAVTVTNHGNSVERAEFACTDPEAVEVSTFDRPTLDLAPGEQRSTTMRISGKRPWFGQPITRVLTVSLAGGVEGTEQFVTIAHRPRVSRILVSFVGLLIAASMFGIVFSRNLTNVVESTALDPALLEQAFGNATPGDGAEPGQITGTVIARSSKTGIAGATVELYLVAEPSLPVRSVATDADGVYLIDNLGPGPFRLRAVAGGFDSRWFGDVAEFDNATDVAIESGETAGAIDMLLGGQPATLEGLVVGGAVEGATVDLIVPAEATGGTTDAVYLSSEVDDSGVFRFENVPAPGEYRLRVRRIGSITSLLSLQLAAGEERSGVTIQLRSGDGLIAGTVFGVDGPIGGASVVVATTDVEVGTLTLTTESPGSFSVPGLLTPASYAVTVTAPGFRSQTLTVSLAQGQSLPNLIVSLEPATGSVRGTITSVVGGRLGSVPISLTDGATVWTTSTVTSDDPRTTEVNEMGTYVLEDIPSPGVYTLTIGGGAYSTLTRNLVLVADQRDVTVDVQLTASTSTVFGTVYDEEIDPANRAGGVEVTLTNGQVTKVVTTSTTCLGGGTACVGDYRFDGLVPGTYSLTFRRTGSVPVSRQVVLRGGAEVRSDVTLAKRSGIVVQVCRTATTTGGVTTCSSGSALVGYQVRLWLEADFPGAAPVAAALTGSDGTASFNSLDAPVRYVVEVAPVAGEPGITSVVVALGPSQTLEVDIEVPER